MRKRTRKATDLERFGPFLKETRKSRGLSQARVAEMATEYLAAFFSRFPENYKWEIKLESVSQSLVAQLESGISTNPSPILLSALSECYDVPIHEILAELFKDKYWLDDAHYALLKKDVFLLPWLILVAKEDWPKSVWIAMPDVIPDPNQLLDWLTAELVSNGCVVTYLVRDIDTLEGGRFAIRKSVWKRQLPDVDVDSSVKAFPLTHAQVALLATGLVLFNPETVFADEGNQVCQGFYLVPGLNHLGYGPCAIMIEKAQLHPIVINLSNALPGLHPSSSQDSGLV